MKKTDLPNLILDGRLDSVLDELATAVHARRRIVADIERQRNLQNLRPGMRVRIKLLRPKYLTGLQGEVIERLDSLDAFSGDHRFSGTLPVKLDAGRVRRYGPVVHVPANCLERIG